MLGAQYAFIETVHISNAVTATLFQFLGPVLITMYVAFEQKKIPCFHATIRNYSRANRNILYYYKWLN